MIIIEFNFYMCIKVCDILDISFIQILDGKNLGYYCEKIQVLRIYFLEQDII